MKRFVFLVVIFSFSHLLVQSQSCLPEGIIFDSQAQIDSFQLNYPGCCEIEGSVTISGGDSITNLFGLSTIKSIWGNFLIESNSEIKNLIGLDIFYIKMRC